MSIRSSSSNAKTSSNAIDFTPEFHSANEQTVGQIMQRLDQLNTKISSAQPDLKTDTKTENSLAARVLALERIHEDTLQKLATKLEAVERQAGQSKTAEALVGKISSQFGVLQSRLESQASAADLVDSLTSKFAKLEARIQAADKVQDRLSRLEARFDAHSDHPERLNRLESGAPNPEHERILNRINAKIDKLNTNVTTSTKTLDDDDDDATLGAERANQIKFLQERITKLKRLRENYATAQ